MKLSLVVFLSCLGLFLSTGSFASCGEFKGCTYAEPTFMSCGPGPGTSCNCADAACREENPCLSAASCCQAFGNISGLDGFPND